MDWPDKVSTYEPDMMAHYVAEGGMKYTCIHFQIAPCQIRNMEPTLLLIRIKD